VEDQRVSELWDTSVQFHDNRIRVKSGVYLDCLNTFLEIGEGGRSSAHVLLWCAQCSCVRNKRTNKNLKNRAEFRKEIGEEEEVGWNN